MREHTQGEPLRSRYSSQNQPPSLEAARARQEELDRKIAEIETQLELITSGRDTTRHVTWRRNAAGALGWTKGEQKFLARWIEQQTASSADLNDPRAAKKARDRMITELAAFVEERTAYFNNAFLERYGGHLPAPSIDEIPAILLVLVQLAQECAVALVEFGARSTQLNLSNNDTAKMRKPLGTINHAILQAISHLKSRAEPSKKFDRVGFLVSLLNRAIAGGFILSEEERATYEKILSERSATGA